MGGAGRMDRQALRVPDVGQMADQLQAVDEFRRTRNQFPRLTDYLALLRGLGWRKVPADTTSQADSQTAEALKRES